MEMVAPLLYMLAGVCGLSGAYYLVNGARRPRNQAHVWFALVAFAMVPFAVSQVAGYEAASPQSYVAALRWNISAILLVHIFFIWFVATYTGVTRRIIVWGATFWFGGLFVANLLAPFTLQYAGTPYLEPMIQPWGESLAHGVGEPGPLLRTGWVSLILSHLFWMYALWYQYRRDRERSSLLLVVAIGIQSLTSLEGALVREGVSDLVHLGPFGYLLLVVTTGLVLDYRAWHRLRDSENRFRQLVEQCPMSIQICDPDGRIRMVNPRFAQLWGLSADRLSGYNILEDQQLVEKGAMPYIERAFHGTATEVPPIVYNPADNESVPGPFRDRWVGAHIYPVNDDRGRLREVILIHEDVTEREQAEAAIRQIASGVAGVTDDRFFPQLVHSLAELFGARCAFLAVIDEHDPRRARTLATWMAGEAAPAREYAIAGTPSEQVLKLHTYVVTRAATRQFPADTWLAQLNAESYIGTALLGADGDPIGLIGVIDDRPLELPERYRAILGIFTSRAAAELQRLGAEARIRRMAYEDYLTGLGSRPYFHERLAEARGHALQSGHFGALILMDLDHFKIINDALSHDVGDQLLRAVGARVRNAAGATAFVARFGGDEFVALLDTETDDRARAEAAADDLAVRIREQLASPVNLGERALTIDASMGVVVFPAGEGNELDILRHADMALNSAKRQGRGNTRFYEPELQSAAARRLQVGEGLRSAIAGNQLSLRFQPQVDTHGDLAGMEALLRWHHPVLGDVPPSVFIPVAEETGMIHPLGQWMLDVACAHIQRWERERIAWLGHLAVNVSAWQFIAPDFVGQVREIMEQHQVDPRHVMLELTETALLYDLQDSIAKLQSLRALGLSIALDDFGTGYSSLAYLKDLPLDQLKIDKSFTTELEGAGNAPLVETMLAIGRHMGLSVVAEGVETDRQRDRLERMGCEIYQGFRFSAPLSEEGLRQWLQGDHAWHAEPT